MGGVACLVENNVSAVDAAGEHVVGAAGGADASDAAVAGLNVQSGNLALVDAVFDLGLGIGGSHDAGQTGSLGSNCSLVCTALDIVEVLAVGEAHDTGNGKAGAAVVGVDGVLGSDDAFVNAVLNIACVFAFSRVHLTDDTGQALAGEVRDSGHAHRGLVRTTFHGGVERKSGHASYEGHRGALSLEDSLRADNYILHCGAVEDAEETCGIACGSIGGNTDLEVIHGMSLAVENAREGNVALRDDAGIGY